MSNDERKEFYDTADEFVRLANELSSKWPRSRVSAAILYAAARYYVFNYLNADLERTDTREQALNYFSQQYREMLLENFETLEKDKS